MSCQKGNGNRSRPQKYQNSHAFKNNLHDTSHKTKFINKIQVVNVCEKCKKIIEWKIKYKKYKPLTAPSKCTKCNEKCVKYAYHIMCGPCASQHHVCPKCGEKTEVIKPEIENEPVQLDRELRLLLKKLPERKRRTFLRYMNRKATAKENAKRCEKSDNDENKVINDSDEDDSSSDTETVIAEDPPLSRDDLLNKLKSLMVTKKPNDDFDDCESESDDDDDDDDDDDSNEDSDNANDLKKM